MKFIIYHLSGLWSASPSSGLSASGWPASPLSTVGTSSSFIISVANLLWLIGPVDHPADVVLRFALWPLLVVITYLNNHSKDCKMICGRAALASLLKKSDSVVRDGITLFQEICPPSSATFSPTTLEQKYCASVRLQLCIAWMDHGVDDGGDRDLNFFLRPFEEKSSNMERIAIVISPTMHQSAVDRTAVRGRTWSGRSWSAWSST